MTGYRRSLQELFCLATARLNYYTLTPASGSCRRSAVVLDADLPPAHSGRPDPTPYQ